MEEDKSSLLCSQKWTMKPILSEFSPLYTLTTSVRKHWSHYTSVYRTVSGRKTIFVFMSWVESCSLAYPVQFSSLAHHACYPVGTELLTNRNVEFTTCLCVVRKWWICVYLPPLFPRKLSNLDALLGTWILLWQAAWCERGGSILF